jgi:hypothetical protein
MVGTDEMRVAYKIGIFSTSLRASCHDSRFYRQRLAFMHISQAQYYLLTVSNVDFSIGNQHIAHILDLLGLKSVQI